MSPIHSVKTIRLLLFSGKKMFTRSGGQGEMQSSVLFQLLSYLVNLETALTLALTTY